MRDGALVHFFGRRFAGDDFEVGEGLVVFGPAEEVFIVIAESAAVVNLLPLTHIIYTAVHTLDHIDNREVIMGASCRSSQGSSAHSSATQNCRRPRESLRSASGTPTPSIPMHTSTSMRCLPALAAKWAAPG